MAGVSGALAIDFCVATKTYPLGAFFKKKKLLLPLTKTISIYPLRTEYSCQRKF